MTTSSERMARLCRAICPGPLAAGQLTVVRQIVEAVAPTTGARTTNEGGLMATATYAGAMSAPGVGFDAAQADSAADGYGRTSTYGPLIPMADDECEHGRLPGDRTAPCGCYPCEGDCEAGTS